MTSGEFRSSTSRPAAICGPSSDVRPRLVSFNELMPDCAPRSSERVATIHFDVFGVAETRKGRTTEEYASSQFLAGEDDFLFSAGCCRALPA